MADNQSSRAKEQNEIKSWSIDLASQLGKQLKIQLLSQKDQVKTKFSLPEPELICIKN